MDSATVALIAATAEKLGMTGAQAFGWYVMARCMDSLLFAGVATLVAILAYRLLTRNLWGTRVCDALGAPWHDEKTIEALREFLASRNRKE